MSRPSLNLLATSSNPDGLFPAKPRNRENNPHILNPFFKSVQWSADGTTLFTSSSSNRISTFVLPSTLLDPRPSPVDLAAQSTLTLPEPSNAIAPCPYFALEQPSTQVLLTASKDHPIHLHHVFPQPSPTPSPPIASFRLIKHETEAYMPITSLIWPAPGTHFIAGTTNRIALFDVSRPDATLASTPFQTIATIPSTRHIAKGNGIGMRGTVSALAANVRSPGDAGLVAAGTWTRSMGLYDLQRAGSCVATWSVAGAAREGAVGGRGVMQVLWSPCGRYLVVNERMARGLLVYDLRGTNELLACLTGRDGQTNQRLSCDVFPGSEGSGGFEVWAGTKDGGVVVWEGVGGREGCVEPSWEREVHASSVGGVAMHMSGSVLATVSGSWRIDDGESSDEESSDESDEESSSSGASEASHKNPLRASVVVEETSLKVWSIGASTTPEPERPSQSEDSIES
ncbi:WD40-repeat-containing domain protein [Podospora appendiculata]|uniref:WD40-repeat-containing domain protein n=1 Tax=Podospora appendiculata TaxID=314037 RepID=A0AAE0X804_9PEZI|nr:WD40-repeat-containing domain protein [Podospora appendiculata]